ncbi:flagellar type III secretion system protein FlhB [Salidesulfovibrio brasiliensis]|uniref:flagellar type III secretion system protein FlhB n=1 Tax=Salidesulfovibrio brasiliensis TaxID=221711 RepID=UPI0006D1FA2D|nr:flagellar type III secretion system protein FlhB [Salidesulfovibrio brasiliensis]
MAKDPSRTEKATPKQRNKQRNKGNVPKGQELTKTLVLVAGVFTVRALFEYFYTGLTNTFKHTFTKLIFISELDQPKVYELFKWGSVVLAKMVLPVMIIMAFIAFLSERLQVGHLWTFTPLKPKFGKVFNLMSGLKKLMLSPEAFMRLGRSILQAIAVGIAPYIVIKQEMHNLVPLFYMTPEGLSAYILSVAYKMLKYAMVPMIIIAILDCWFMRWRYEEGIKMTKDEVKDERKQAEGDPEIKQKQQQKFMEFMAHRLQAEVPKADVVVTNPTHFAVALRYNVMEAPAPMVVAKGADRLAEMIKDIARENNVPIRENKPLAQALYKQVEIGETIPEELFQAVASILAQLDKFQTGR